MLPRTALLVIALLPLSLAAGDGAQTVAQAPPPTPDMSQVPWSPVRRNPTPGKAAPKAPPPSTSDPAASPNAIQVQVKLVNVLTSVAEPGGEPYTGLGKGDFRIFEDDVEQQIAVFERQSGLPLSIVMALDTSLSTRKDLLLETEAARRFAHDVLSPPDRLALFQFSNDVSQALGFTGDLRRIDEALNHLRTGRATALYDAIYLAAGALESRQGRKIIVLITDGGDSSSKVGYAQALRAAQLSDAVIFSIIMVPIESDAGRDVGGEHALIQLAGDTGGAYYYASSRSQLDQAFARIGDALRTQYLLAYYPKAAPGKRGDGDFRRIRVELAPEVRQRVAGKLTLRYRAGYYLKDAD